MEKGSLPTKLPPKTPFQKALEEVFKKVALRREADYKQAVIQADNLLEDIIKRLGFPNIDSAISQKKLTKEHLSNIDELWLAHKAKVKMASDPNFRLTQEEAKKLVSVYEAAFKEWGIL